MKLVNFYPVVEIKLGVGELCIEYFVVAQHSCGGDQISLGVEDA